MKTLLFTLFIFLPITIFGREDSMKDLANNISQHYSAMPNLYDFDSVKKEELSDKITRQYVMGSQSMLVKWTLKKGAVIPMHFHASEQITWITSGSVEVLSQGKKFIVKSGEVFIIPPYVPHEFHALEDTIDIDYFAPVREDWLNNTASYIQQVKQK